MSDERKESRRSFIRRSAFAVGILGGTGVLRIPGAKASPPNGPDYLYPWNVQVGPARVYLYLLWRKPIHEILFSEFRQLVAHMDRGLDAAQGTEDEERIVKELLVPITFAGFRERFSDLRIALANDTRTYADFITNPISTWGPAIEQSLRRLDGIIRVPPLTFSESASNLQRTAALQFLDSDEGTGGGQPNRDKIDATSTSVYDWLTGSYPMTERPLWRRARQRGLIWCSPTINADGTPMKFISINDEIRPLYGNGYTCNAQNVCVRGEPEDYCQMVNDGCNV